MATRWHSLQSLSRHVPKTTRHQQRTRLKSSSPPITSASEGHYKIIDRAPDFLKKQSSRPVFDARKPVALTQSPNPTWKYGSGSTKSASSSPSPRSDAADAADAAESRHAPTHIEIDPYAPTRPMLSNYRLLTSAIAPRPIGLLSTVSTNGAKNLAPFSYFQIVDHDPPLFIIGFSARPGAAKDSFLNLKETGECVINSVSEDMIEGVSAASLDPPRGVEEWGITGFTEEATTTVKPGRVGESVFSVEGRVVDVKEFEHTGGLSTAATVLIQATRFWVRADAANEERSLVDLEKLRPVGQLGGMAYARVSEIFEVPRKRWADEVEKSRLLRELERGFNGRDGEGERDAIEEAQRVKEEGSM
ncbi:hypothetical protein EKO04_003709 [Ascochyta lentis]|uniref:Flavin reductase like domain-containing protein n=1 Tax=Ascochyta lentis TaxID=205686 RepID=A0A8H7J8F4_9PLEO|nr:hypothetical protein EKO04_003709 [Ascochyta lentis]